MRLLLLADEADRYLWDHYRPGCLEGTDSSLPPATSRRST